MKVYNEDKTKELIEYDIALGYLKNDNILIKHNDEVKENIVYKTTVFSMVGYQKFLIWKNQLLQKRLMMNMKIFKSMYLIQKVKLKTKKIAKLKEYLNTTWRWKNERHIAELEEIKLGLREKTTQTTEEIILDRKAKVDEINSLES